MINFTATYELTGIVTWIDESTLQQRHSTPVQQDLQIDRHDDLRRYLTTTANYYVVLRRQNTGNTMNHTHWF